MPDTSSKLADILLERSKIEGISNDKYLTNVRRKLREGKKLNDLEADYLNKLKDSWKISEQSLDADLKRYREHNKATKNRMKIEKDHARQEEALNKVRSASEKEFQEARDRTIALNYKSSTLANVILDNMSKGFGGLSDSIKIAEENQKLLNEQIKIAEKDDPDKVDGLHKQIIKTEALLDATKDLKKIEEDRLTALTKEDVDNLNNKKRLTLALIKRLTDETEKLTNESKKSTKSLAEEAQEMKENMTSKVMQYVGLGAAAGFAGNTTRMFLERESQTIDALYQTGTSIKSLGMNKAKLALQTNALSDTYTLLYHEAAKLNIPMDEINTLLPIMQKRLKLVTSEGLLNEKAYRRVGTEILRFSKYLGVDATEAVETYRTFTKRLMMTEKEASDVMSSFSTDTRVFTTILGGARMESDAVAKTFLEIQQNTRYWTQDVKLLSNSLNRYVALQISQGISMDKSLETFKSFNDLLEKPPSLTAWEVGNDLIKELRSTGIDWTKDLKGQANAYETLEKQFGLTKGEANELALSMKLIKEPVTLAEEVTAKLGKTTKGQTALFKNYSEKISQYGAAVGLDYMNVDPGKMGAMLKLMKDIKDAEGMENFGSEEGLDKLLRKIAKGQVDAGELILGKGETIDDYINKQKEMFTGIKGKGKKETDSIEGLSTEAKKLLAYLKNPKSQFALGLLSLGAAVSSNKVALWANTSALEGSAIGGAGSGFIGGAQQAKKLAPLMALVPWATVAAGVFATIQTGKLVKEIGGWWKANSEQKKEAKESEGRIEGYLRDQFPGMSDEDIKALASSRSGSRRVMEKRAGIFGSTNLVAREATNEETRAFEASIIKKEVARMKAVRESKFKAGDLSGKDYFSQVSKEASILKSIGLTSDKVEDSVYKALMKADEIKKKKAVLTKQAEKAEAIKAVATGGNVVQTSQGQVAIPAYASQGENAILESKYDPSTEKVTFELMLDQYIAQINSKNKGKP